MSFTSLYTILGIFCKDLYLYLLPVFLVNFVIGIISWPFSAIFFSKLSDKGYTISHIVGWFSISYIVFTLVTLGVIPLSLNTIYLVIVGWVLLNLGLFRRSVLKQGVNFRQIVKIQVSFLFLMIFWYVIRARQPTIAYIERVPDFGILKSLFNATSLPLFDIWLVGKSVNYYYFGHFVGYVILSISNVDPVPGFFVLVVWMFALCSISIYRFGKDLYLFSSVRTKSWYLSNMSGFLSVFFVLFAGTLHSLLFLYRKIRNLLWNEPVKFFYPLPTRYIDGTIADMPIYSFLVSDIHAHMWGLFMGIVVITLLLVWWFDIKKETTYFDIKKAIFLGVILGFSYITNSWEFLTLTVLSLTILFFKYKTLIDKYYLILGLLGAIPILGFLISLPWSLYFSSPIAGIGFVEHSSALWKWFAYWGGFLILSVPFVFKSILKVTKNKIFLNFKKDTTFLSVCFVVIIFFLVLVEVVFVKDILKGGEHYRANTVFKVYHQLWLWYGLLLGYVVLKGIILSKKKLLNFIFVIPIILIQCVYPILAIYQAQIAPNKYTGIITGLDWWKKQYPFDYEAYEFLSNIQDQLPLGDKMRVIVEADGESFSENNLFSTFLGWPTIVGWSGHIWTYRGSYDEVSIRRADVREIYIGSERGRTRTLLKKYDVDFVIIGSVEKRTYGNLIQMEKLLAFGEIVFDNQETKILKLNNLY